MFGIREIDSHQLEQAMKTGVQLIDVRTDAEHAQAKIEGSTHIPLHLLPLKLQDLKAASQPIVVYCRSGARSAPGLRLADVAGHPERLQPGRRHHGLGARGQGARRLRRAGIFVLQ